MKIINSFFLLVFFLVISCEKYKIDTPDGFYLVSDNKVVISHKDFEYYDYSAHLIYLKNRKSFADDIEGLRDFSVYADGVKIYSGQTHSSFSSYKPSGPVINTEPSHYEDNIISIDFNQVIDTLGNLNSDTREDTRIIKALKKYDQFHSGLSCEINSVKNTSQNKLTIELQLSNNDSFDYYYLDPDKMGINLFHFFTNGLYLRNLFNNEFYSYKPEVTPPEPWDLWKKEWLSIIKSNENKLISLTYDSSESVMSGEYRASFTFPGLSHVSKRDIQQDNGRIWLGELKVFKNINFE